MSVPVPPRIFSQQRRHAVQRRMRSVQQRGGAPAYILDDMIDDAIERLGFLRHEPQTALVIGDEFGRLADPVRKSGTEVTVREPDVVNLERPIEGGPFDLVAVFGLLDTINDLPGALLHIRYALAPGGLALASFVGAGSLARLRQIMLAADGERPSARMHPQVDVRSGAALMQRAGFDDPVVDSHGLAVRFTSLRGLVADLRAMGLSSVLEDRPAPLSKAALARAEAAFAGAADADGKLAERFEIVTLSGWNRGRGLG